MKKFVITGMAVAMLAVPSAAMAGGAYEQPGYAVAKANAATNESGASTADHGTFGVLGAQGVRHDLGQGDNMGDAYLGASPLTGLSNASVMGNGTPEPHAPVTPLDSE
jgi:hypothetical protein